MQDGTIAQPGEESVKVQNRLVGVVQARDATITSGGAGVVIGQSSVSLTSAGAMAIIAGNSVSIERGGGQLLVAGSMKINQSGGQVLVSGGQMSLERSGGLVMLTPRAHLRRSFIGVLLTNSADMREGSRVLLGTRQALALGVAFGLVFAMVSRLPG